MRRDFCKFPTLYVDWNPSWPGKESYQSASFAWYISTKWPSLSTILMTTSTRSWQHLCSSTSASFLPQSHSLSLSWMGYRQGYWPVIYVPWLGLQCYVRPAIRFDQPTKKIRQAVTITRVTRVDRETSFILQWPVMMWMVQIKGPKLDQVGQKTEWSFNDCRSASFEEGKIHELGRSRAFYPLEKKNESHKACSSYRYGGNEPTSKKHCSLSTPFVCTRVSLVKSSTAKSQAEFSLPRAPSESSAQPLSFSFPAAALWPNISCFVRPNAFASLFLFLALQQKAIPKIAASPPPSPKANPKP